MYTQTSVFPREFTHSSIKYYPSSKLNKPTGWEPQSCDVTGYSNCNCKLLYLTEQKPDPNQTKGLFSLSAQDLPPIFYRRPRSDPQTDFKVTHDGPKFKCMTYSLIAIPWFEGFFLISTLMRFSIYIFFLNFNSTKSNLVVYLAKSYIPGNLQKLGYLKRWSEGLCQK